MLFKPGTYSYELTKVNTKDQDGNWFCAGRELPEELESFDHSAFYYKVEELASTLQVAFDAGAKRILSHPDEQCSGHSHRSGRFVCKVPPLLLQQFGICHR